MRGIIIVSNRTERVDLAHFTLFVLTFLVSETCVRVAASSSFYKGTAVLKLMFCLSTLQPSHFLGGKSLFL